MEAGQSPRWRGAREAPVEPARRGEPQLGHGVLQDHIGERLIVTAAAQPEMMRPVDITENEMPPVSQSEIGEDDGPAGEIQRNDVTYA